MALTLPPLEPEELATALEDLPDWRQHPRALATAYEAGNVSAALDLMAAVGAAAEQADHHPDVDWRHRHVFVRTTTHAAGNQVTARDTALATRISALAAERGVAAVPVAARSYEIGVDAVDPAALAQTWAAGLGYRMGPQEDEVSDPFGRGPTVWFQRTDAPSASRLHLDVHVADELQDQTVTAVGTSGGRTLDASNAPSFVVVTAPRATGSASAPRTDRACGRQHRRRCRRWRRPARRSCTRKTSAGPWGSTATRRSRHSHLVAAYYGLRPRRPPGRRIAGRQLER